MKVNLMERKQIKVTTLDVLCLLVGRVIFWALTTILTFYFALFVGKICYRIGCFVYPFVVTHLLLCSITFSSLVIILFTIHYFRHDFVILRFDDTKYIVRKRILRFIRKPRVFNNYDLKI